MPRVGMHGGSAGVDGPHEIGHPDGGYSGAVAVVPLLATGAVYGLLNRVCGQHAEYDWYARRDRGIGDTLRRFSGHVTIVIGLSSNHGSEANHSIVLSGVGHLPGNQRELE